MKWIVIFSIEWHCCLRKGAIARHRKGLTGEITFKLSSKIDSWGEGLQFLQARIHTSVHRLQKLVRLFTINVFLIIIKKLSKLKSGKWFGQMSKNPAWMTWKPRRASPLQPPRSLRPLYSLGNRLVFILDQC